MFELCEDKQTDFMIRLFGLKCFVGGLKMTLITRSSDKPEVFRNKKNLIVHKLTDGKTESYIAFNTVKHTVSTLEGDELITKPYNEIEPRVDEIK